MNKHNITVPVRLEHCGYDIQIGSGTLALVGEAVADGGAVSHAVVVTDEHVVSLYAATVTESLQKAGVRVDQLVVEPGETSKSVDRIAFLWSRMLEIGADRKSLVLALGGGVVGDLAGFLAASYARGLSFFQVPTTLLAQVDSSVGGKVGINLPGAKNIVGAFWQPKAVLIDTDALTTLPEREYAAGLAEVVKYGVILDADFFRFLEDNIARIEQRDSEVLGKIVARCCQLKADVVQADERELTGVRAVLNYGHTFCHALEAITHYGQYLHGEAVSIGMLCASRLAERLGRVDADMTERQRRLLETLGLPVIMPELDVDDFVDAMARDKKVEHGRLRFVLPSRMGHVELVGDVDPADVRAVIWE